MQKKTGEWSNKNDHPPATTSHSIHMFFIIRTL